MNYIAITAILFLVVGFALGNLFGAAFTCKNQGYNGATVYAIGGSCFHEIQIK